MKTKKILAILSAIDAEKREIDIAISEWLEHQTFEASSVAKLFQDMQSLENLSEYIKKNANRYLSASEQGRLEMELGPDVQVVYDRGYQVNQRGQPAEEPTKIWTQSERNVEQTSDKSV